MTTAPARPTEREAPQAPASPPSRPPVGNWPWLISAAVAAAVIFTSFSLNGVLFGWGWMPQVVFTIAAVLAATAGARVLRVPSGLIPVAGIAVLVAAVTLLFFAEESLLGFIPTRETLDALWIELLDANQVVVNQVAPVEATDGIVLVTCLGLGLVALLLDTLTATLQMPATSGLGLLAVLVVPAIVKSSSVGAAGYTSAIVGYLILLGSAHWIFSQGTASSSSYSASQLDRALVIGAAALAATLVLPLAVPGFTSGLFPEGARLSLGTSSGLNPMVTLGNDLRNPGSVGRMTYTTTSEEPVYLRAVTLEHFDGVTWEPDQRQGQRITRLDAIGSETEELLEGPTEYATTRIDAGNFVSPWLPVPYAPVEISGLAGQWTVDPLTLSILGMDQSTTSNQAYIVTSATPVLTRETLAEASAIPRDGLADPFLELPDELPQLIEETVDDVTEGITNRYRKAMAIQNYLRSEQFVYSETAPVRGGYDGSSMDVVARFLEEKSGYCVHYSAAMAVMARAEGIPSRIAVGYAPGTATGETVITADGIEMREFEVDSNDAHAWPELYFAGLGWVKFEPTPSRGVVPDYARGQSQNPNAGLNPNNLNPDDLENAAEEEEPEPQDDATTGSRASSDVDDGGPSWIAITLTLGMALALAGTPYLIRRWITRRRLRSIRKRPELSAITAWREINDTATDHRVRALQSETPRVFADRLGATALGGTDGVRGAGIPGAENPVPEDPAVTAEALNRLLLAYEQAEYGRPHPLQNVGHRGVTSARGRTRASGLPGKGDLPTMAGTGTTAAGKTTETGERSADSLPSGRTALATAGPPPASAADVVTVQEAMYRRATLQQRLVAVLLPASLWSPWRRTQN